MSTENDVFNNQAIMSIGLAVFVVGIAATLDYWATSSDEPLPKPIAAPKKPAAPTTTAAPTLPSPNQSNASQPTTAPLTPNVSASTSITAVSPVTKSIPTPSPSTANLPLPSPPSKVLVPPTTLPPPSPPVNVLTLPTIPPLPPPLLTPPTVAPPPPPPIQAFNQPTTPANGEKVYRNGCFVCHDVGIANSPKPGDKAAWESRLRAGKQALYANVWNGKGQMPAKGGNPGLSAADIQAAVDWMLAQ